MNHASSGVSNQWPYAANRTGRDQRNGAAVSGGERLEIAAHERCSVSGDQHRDLVCFFARHTKWFFAKRRSADGQNATENRNMLGVLCADREGVNLRIGENGIEIRDERAAEARRE